MKIWIFFIVLAILFLVENVYLSLPLVFDVILLTYIVRRDAFVFPLALCIGILFDVLSFEEIGTRSIFFLCFLFLVMFYEKKFEIRTYPFVFFSSFFGGMIFLFLFNHQLIFWQALVNSVIVVFVWRGIQSQIFSDF